MMGGILVIWAEKEWEGWEVEGSVKSPLCHRVIVDPALVTRNAYRTLPIIHGCTVSYSQNKGDTGNSIILKNVHTDNIF